MNKSMMPPWIMSFDHHHPQIGNPHCLPRLSVASPPCAGPPTHSCLALTATLPMGWELCITNDDIPFYVDHEGYAVYCHVRRGWAMSKCVPWYVLRANMPLCKHCSSVFLHFY